MSYNVAVIGNSNSVAVTSYARILVAHPGISLKNYSIGGIPNVLLLSFLTEPDVDLSVIDIIIVELAVIEGMNLHRDSSYTLEQSSMNIDLFMQTVRARSSARVVFLILPTLFGLLESDRFFGEKHYLRMARRHGADVLNGYAIVRRIGGLDSNGPPADLRQKVERLTAAFDLGNRESRLFSLWLQQSPSELHGPFIGTKAFCEQVFEDALHISRAFHGLIADLLHRWITRTRTVPRRSFAPTEPLAIRSDPAAAGVSPIVRESSFVSRHVTPITEANTAIYPCGPEWVATALLVNECRTCGFLNLASPLGQSSINVRFHQHARPWNAVIVLIPGSIGGGGVRVTISTSPHYQVCNHTYLGTGNGGTDAIAEIGEMILVKRNWRDSIDDGATLPEVHIEDQDWAHDMIDAVATIGARTADGMKRSNVIMNRSAFLRHISGDAIAKARLLAAAGETDAAISVIAEGLGNDPDSVALQEMQRALSDMA